MYQNSFQFHKYTHARAHVHGLAILLHNHYIMCSIAFGHTPIPILMYGLRVVVLHVKQCLQTCCFVVFIVVSFHTHIQSFSFITCPISQLCAQTCPYYNVWPGAVYCCFNKNYNVHKIFNMMLHAGLANPTCLQSFMVWYCSVCCLNSKKEKKKMKENRHFLLTPFPCTNLHDFGQWCTESHEAVKFQIHLILKLKQ